MVGSGRKTTSTDWSVDRLGKETSFGTTAVVRVPPPDLGGGEFFGSATATPSWTDFLHAFSSRPQASFTISYDERVGWPRMAERTSQADLPSYKGWISGCWIVVVPSGERMSPQASR